MIIRNKRTGEEIVLIPGEGIPVSDAREWEPVSPLREILLDMLELIDDALNGVRDSISLDEVREKIMRAL